MKHYIQFKTLSTGYISGTVPPQFSKEHVKPFDELGSDGIHYLDNRLSLNNMVKMGIDLCKVKRNQIGFSIVQYRTSILDGREIKTVLF